MSSNFSSSTPLSYSGLDQFVNPPFIDSDRAPTSLDVQLPGTVWQDNGVNPPVQYFTTGAGVWDSQSAATFSSLTVTGLSTLGALTQVGAASLNATGTAATAIGSASSGAVAIASGAASGFIVTGAGVDLTLSSVGGSVKVNSTENVAGAIALTANGGTSETITVLSSQGTGAASISLTSTAGGVTLSGGLATADAINIVASDAAGGIDVDAGSGGISLAAANGPVDVVAGTGAITIGADATQHNVTIGSTTGTSTTTLQAGSGNVNVAGNLVLSDVATQLRVNGGAATDFIGTATLVAGEVTVANTNIAAGDQIYITRSAVNGSLALGVFSYAISAGASFTISSRNPVDGSIETDDVSIVQYFIVRQI